MCFSTARKDYILCIDFDVHGTIVKGPISSTLLGHWHTSGRLVNGRGLATSFLRRCTCCCVTVAADAVTPKNMPMIPATGTTCRMPVSVHLELPPDYWNRSGYHLCRVLSNL